MATVRPFRAFRPRPEIAHRVSSPPYDVIDTAEARALADGKPESFLHVTRPEIDLPVGTDEHDDAVYEKARENLEAMCAEGVLRQDAEPRLYLYAQDMGGHHQVGVVGCVSVREYDEDRIKKHEKTRADKEDDRTRHVDVLSAHDEPVFLTYRASAEIDAQVRRGVELDPLYDFTTEAGVRHRLWALDPEQSRALAESFEGVSELYVADGHHRSAAASRVHALRKGDGGEHDVFLAVVFPHDQVQILPYNRVVRDLDGRSVDALRAELEAIFELSPAERPEPPSKGVFGLYLGGRWWQARVRAGSFDASDPVASLDCSICQDQLLGPIFRVTDPRRDAHVEFVGGIRGAKEVARRVDEGRATLGIVLFPTSVNELIAVSDRGLLMPPKSTWFEPKLESGLFVHVF